ncbi:MAG: MvaI/BcnI family restriction endonuclease, partial [Akkermansiaceae bacterium]
DVDGLRKLNCSVYATKVNSQGLFLDLKEELEQLHELFKNGEKSEPVCLWKTPTLHYSLLEKHQETFWITADEIKSRGKKYFHLQKVKHTRRPSTVQFNRLLSTGEISVDHMIKQSGNKVRERGPQFKIKGAALEELFIGVTREYQLDI